MNQSVKKAFEILSYVVDNQQRQSLQQMAQALELNKTTLFRFLHTLESLNLLDKKNDHYVPGIKLFELGSKVPVKQLIIDKIHPLLVELTKEVNETVNMGELKSNQVLYLDKTESQRSLQIQTNVGNYIGLYCSALGKSILSLLPEEKREHIITGLNFSSKTEHTITSPQQLLEVIRDVCEKGYSTDAEETEEGLNCVAVPLYIEELSFFGAISCSGPIVRFTPQYIRSLALKLQETVMKIKQIFKA